MKQLSRSARFAGIAAALVAAFTLATAAHADPLKCKQEIAKDASKYVQAKTKALQKCHDAIVTNKLPPSTNCLTDPTASAKIAKADSKLRAGLSKQCGGADKTCSTTGDGNDSLASIGWPSACPNFENGTCNMPIANCDDISDCLICTAEAAVDQSITLSYGALDGGQFGSGSAINKCQRAIGKNAAKFLGAKSKALAKCEKGVMKGTVTGPCPDAAGAVLAINKAETKKIAGICKACGGADKVCGGGDDLTPAQIGFGSTCPNVTIPPGGPACGGPIATLQDIVTCVDCVNEFKADCLDPLAVPALKSYPSAQCNGEPPCAATPNNTPTPCPTATPPVVCPTRVVTDANGPAVDLDTGWTGISHDAHAPTNNRLTLAVSGCANPDATTCGVCNTSGPLDNPGGQSFNAHRCVLDTSFSCETDPDCTGLHCRAGTNPGAACTVASECPGGTCAAGPGGTCTFYFGSPLALSAGGVSVCVTNQITAPISGTVDVEAGTTANTINLLSRVYTGPTLDKPCPNCTSGTCETGPHATDACTVNGHSDLFGDVSFDCPPDGGANVGNLPIVLVYDTGTQTRTLSASNPVCRAPGFNGSHCFCDSCNNAAATPCTSNADCVAAGATICGGRRCASGANNGAPCALNSECPGSGCSVPGAQTQPNQCDDNTCSPTATCVGGCNNFLNCTGAFSCVGGANGGALCTVNSECPGGSCDAQCPGGSCVLANEGTCAAGPFETFCAIQTFRSCAADSDCFLAGDTCTLGKFRDCFLDNGGIGGSVTVSGIPYPSCGGVGTGVVGALFCVPPTSSSSVNSVSGLPGLGRISLPYTANFN